MLSIADLNFGFENLGDGRGKFFLEGPDEVIAAAAEVVIRSLGPEAIAAVEAQLAAVLAEADGVS